MPKKSSIENLDQCKGDVDSNYLWDGRKVQFQQKIMCLQYKSADSPLLVGLAICKYKQASSLTESTESKLNI